MFVQLILLVYLLLDYKTSFILFDDKKFTIIEQINKDINNTIMSNSKLVFLYMSLIHLMHSSDAECILMFLSAMPRGVSVAHIYVLKLPLHHL